MIRERIAKSFMVIVFTIATVLTPLLAVPTRKVEAASKKTIISAQDAMVRKNVPNKNYGAWNDMTVGRAWNLGNYFSDARSFIKFNLSGFNNQTIIQSARLDVFQYVRSDYASGNYRVKVAKVNSSWSELGITWNNQPSFSGTHAQKWVSGNAGQYFNPPQKNSFDITNLVQKWVDGSTPNHGLVMLMNSGNYGGFWCSRNYNGRTCFASSRPRLVISYKQNHPPNTPRQVSPANLEEFGGDSSGGGKKVTLKVDRLGDPDGNLDGTWFYYKKSSASSWSQSPKRTGRKSAQFTRKYGNAKWYWRARSRDTMGKWGNYSTTRIFTVDTVPPTQPSIVDEPEFTPGNQNTVKSSESKDKLVGEVKYQFEMNSKADCSQIESKSNWQESREITFSDLEHDNVYCFRVRAQDKLGNTTGWSSYEKSRQDAVLPDIVNVDLTNKVFSPNGDGKFDTTKFSFNIIEQYFDKWKLEINDHEDITVRTFSGNKLTDEIVWDGKNEAGEVVIDGPYTFKFAALDKAGNKAVDSSLVAIVDNKPATLNISQPKHNSWFNTDQVTISGISEVDAKVTVNGIPYEVDVNGIFEGKEDIGVGKTEFEVIAIDIVGNSTKKVINVNKELDIPLAHVLKPEDLINNQKFTIDLKLEDLNDEIDQSGVDEKSVYLSITDSDDDELVLINRGENIQPTLGHIKTNCESDSTGGLLSCNYSYVLDKSFQPDGDYSIKTYFSDVAGNESAAVQKQFRLDSHTYIKVKLPKNGALFNHSRISLTGEAELGSTLNISGSKDSRGFEIDPDNERVSNCRTVDEGFGPGWQGVREICDFEVNDLQLEADFENDREVVNEIEFSLTDQAGNIEKKMRTVKVNLFAVNLSIEGDLEYISPNGDGRQDGIDFTMSAKNSGNTDDEAIVSEWKVVIKNSEGQTAKLLNGFDSLPPNYYFDGKDESGDWLEEGTYSYVLRIKTSDGIEFETAPQKFYVKTQVEGEVVITNPKDGTVTTRGVTNVQGQAPTDTVVTICIDMIGIDGECNDEQVVEVDENGFFTGIVPIATYESYIWATATDEAGNDTPKSNLVKVILDTLDPLKSIYALPSLSGINQEMVLRSLVTQNTENVKMEFADWSDLGELPEGEIDWNFIGQVDNFDDEDFEDPCDLAECTWDFSWTTPEVTGGVYEINFIGRKGEKIQNTSLGVRIDGTIPAVPTIINLKKALSLKDLRQYEESYYTNEEELIAEGIAEPLSFVHILLNDDEKSVVKTNAIGRWKSDLTLNSSSQAKTFSITATSSDNVDNRSGISDPVAVVLDTRNPGFEQISTSNKYRQSGQIADIKVNADEVLFSSRVVRKDGAEFQLARAGNPKIFSGSHHILSKAEEGKYEVDVKIEDLAGNRNSRTFNYIIDNTKPESFAVRTDNWGKWNGISAKNDVPANGRLLPEYVIRGRKLVVKGKGEQHGKVEIWLNGRRIDRLNVSNKNCSGKTKAYGQVYYKLCEWKDSIKLGSKEKGYIIQTKIIDRAYNKSNISGGRLVYYDNTDPGKPQENGSNDYWRFGSIKRITNKRLVTVAGKAERLSDLKTRVASKGLSIRSYLKQVSNKGSWQNRIELGGKKGSEYDGVYKVRTESFDAAGNKSKALTFSIVRDTVAPKRPNVKLLGNENTGTLLLKISGEKGTNAICHIYRNGVAIGEKVYRMGSSGSLNINNFTSWRWNSNYEIRVYLKDGARNSSKVRVVKYKTPAIPAGDADTGVDAEVLGSTIDPYGNTRPSHLGKISGSARVNSNGSVNLNLNVPAPRITYTTTGEKGKVKVWGVAPNAGNIKIAFYRKHKKDFWKDLNEAYRRCGWKKFIPGLGLIYASSCVKREYEKIQSRVEFDHKINNFGFEPQNAVVQIFRNGRKVGKEFRVRLANGRWVASFRPGILKPKQKIYAKLRIWGYYIADGANIGYNHWSGRSNVAEINVKPDSYPDGLPISDYYILTGTPRTHAQRPEKAAIDIQVKQGSSWGLKDDAKLYAIADGYATMYMVENRSAVVTIETNNKIWNIHYAHIENDTDRARTLKGHFPRKVLKGDLIGFQGNTGYYNGKRVPEHLHYEINKKINGRDSNYDSVIGICRIAGIQNDCNYRNTGRYPSLRYYKFKK